MRAGTQMIVMRGAGVHGNLLKCLKENLSCMDALHIQQNHEQITEYQK